MRSSSGAAITARSKWAMLEVLQAIMMKKDHPGGNWQSGGAIMDHHFVAYKFSQ